MAELLSLLMPAIGWSLLHFVWQGLLIGWAASLALQLLRNARPQARYAVACGALLLCAARHSVARLRAGVSQELQGQRRRPADQQPLPYEVKQRPAYGWHQQGQQLGHGELLEICNVD